METVAYSLLTKAWQPAKATINKLQVEHREEKRQGCKDPTYHLLETCQRRKKGIQRTATM